MECDIQSLDHRSSGNIVDQRHLEEYLAALAGECWFVYLLKIIAQAQH